TMAKERETSNLPIAGLIAVVLAIGGIWLYQSPLHSSRPSPESGAETRLTHDPVLARLWEDPFAAVDEHREKIVKRVKDAEAIRTTEFGIAQAIPDRPAHAKLLILLVDAGPYAEAVEQRLRARYTVGMALNSAGLHALDTDHIDYFVMTTPSGRRVVIPIERYDDDNIVLWCPDTALRDLAGLVSIIKGHLYSPTIRIFGPNVSATLRKMAAEAASADPGVDWASLAGAEIFSYRATAPLDYVSAGQSLEALFKARGIMFHR